MGQTEEDHCDKPVQQLHHLITFAFIIFDRVLGDR